MADSQRQFAAAVREAQKDPEKDPSTQESLFFIIGKNEDEVEVRYPGTGQLTYLASLTASSEDDIQRWGGFINFLAALMSDKDARILKRALLADELELDGVADMVEEIMEAWGTRPTMRPSASSPQRRSTGRPSTPAASKRASTRSASRSAGS